MNFLHDSTLFVIDIHQNMPISLILTTFDYFQIRPTFAVTPNLILEPCRMFVPGTCCNYNICTCCNYHICTSCKLCLYQVPVATRSMTLSPFLSSKGVCRKCVTISVTCCSCSICLKCVTMSNIRLIHQRLIVTLP